MKTEVIMNILAAIEPNIKTNGLNRVLMHAMKDNSVNKIIETLTDDSPVICLPDKEIILSYFKNKRENDNTKVIRVENVYIDYLDNSISVRLNTNRARYYNDDNTDYEYSKSEKYTKLEWREDYTYETIHLDDLNAFLEKQGSDVDSTKSPVEES